MAQGAILRFASGVVLLMVGMVAAVAANDPAPGDQPNAGASLRADESTVFSRGREDLPRLP